MELGTCPKTVEISRWQISLLVLSQKDTIVKSETDLVLGPAATDPPTL